MSGNDFLSRVPPSNSEAEKSLLASIFVNPKVALDAITEIGLTAADFYNPAHRALMAVFAQLDERREPIEVATVMAALRENGTLELVGAPSYVVELDQYEPTALNAVHFARRVRDASIRRRLGAVCYRLALDTADGPLDDIFAAMRGQHDMLASRRDERPRESTAEVITRIHDSLNRPDGASLATGFIDLDDALGGGFRAGELITLAGRTGEGKSSLALNIAANFARVGKQALFISLEMSADELARRLLHAESRVPPLRFGAFDFSPAECEGLSVARDALCKMSPEILYAPGITPLGIRHAAERFKRKCGDLNLLVVDYVGLVKSDRREERREREVAATTSALKQLAGELRCGALGVSQLNRESQRRDDSTPRLSDLRDSGAVEQDSDAVLFLHHKDDERAQDDRQLRTVDLVVAKNRRGPAGFKIPLLHDPTITLFDNAACQREEH